MTTDSSASPLIVSQPNSKPQSVSMVDVKQARNKSIIRFISLLSAIASCLCAGSIQSFSLYNHLFLERLNYTQTQVNTVAVAAELALYLPVLLIGYLCDRVGPAYISFLSAIFFGLGYALAAFTYNNGLKYAETHSISLDISVWVMATAFVMIGLATNLMYLSAVTTCAKNFRNRKYSGLALTCPIAAFGLSGLWLSQVGSRIFYEHSSEGKSGSVDVFRFFIFLASVISIVGFAGTFLLKVVDEDRLIDDAVDNLERRGLLENSETLSIHQVNYGSTDSTLNEDPEAYQTSKRKSDETLTKSRILNQETKLFLKDPTMWWFAAGFFMITGPGEAFLNNLGTIIGTLYPPNLDPKSIPTTAATHVSIVSISSTIARLIFGTLTDIFAPRPSSDPHKNPDTRLFNQGIISNSFIISRVFFLVGSAHLLSSGQVLLAAGLIQNHADRFWIVSMLIGSGYGALFSLSPLIVSVVWGVENFGTNWGMITMCSALGATLWGLVYSLFYEIGAEKRNRLPGEVEKNLCYGKTCYSTAFWAMAGSVWMGCAFLIWAWKGSRGWYSRGISV